MTAATTDLDSTVDGARLAQKVAAEAVGTFALVFAGCGAIMVDQLSGGKLTHVGVALTSVW
jgi:glycerol uptake facilitator-like aquaporin